MTQERIGFGKSVRIGLIVKGMSRAKLAEEVTQKTGLFCDEKYLSQIINGNRNPPKIKEAICEILEIEEETA